MSGASRSVAGLVVAITGGARGIGLTTARTLLTHGAQVAIGDIDESQLEEAAEQLGIAVYGRLDVSDVESFTAFLDEVERKLGPIDVLINNAGIMPIGLLMNEEDKITRRVLDINVFGVITGTKLALRRMVPRGHGHIINIASLAGETYIPGMATYCASKYAVVGFTDAIRVEYRSSGVDVSAVLPTFTNTELIAGTSGMRGVRNAEPQEIADAILGLIRTPKPKVRVTRLAGTLVMSGRFVTQRLGERIYRSLGGERVLLDDADATARRAYEERVRQS